MQAVFKAPHAALLHSHDRPRLDSYDSGDEFSIDHWLELRKAVDQRDVPLNDEGLPSRAEIEEAVQKIRVRNGARPRI